MSNSKILKKLQERKSLVTNKKYIIKTLVPKFHKPLAKIGFSLFTIRFTQNNIFASLVSSHSQSKSICFSGGSLGFKGKARQSQESIQKILELFVQLISKEPLGKFGIRLTGQSRLKHFFVRRFTNIVRTRVRGFSLQPAVKSENFPIEVGFELPLSSCFYIKEDMSIAFNGCRLPKPKRK